MLRIPISFAYWLKSPFFWDFLLKKVYNSFSQWLHSPSWGLRVVLCKFNAFNAYIQPSKLAETERVAPAHLSIALSEEFPYSFPLSGWPAFQFFGGISPKLLPNKRIKFRVRDGSHLNYLYQLLFLYFLVAREEQIPALIEVRSNCVSVLCVVTLAQDTRCASVCVARWPKNKWLQLLLYCHLPLHAELRPSCLFQDKDVQREENYQEYFYF